MQKKNNPVILWFRQDLRLHDNPALIYALEQSPESQIIPVYVLDDISPGPWKRGAASRWWLHHSLRSLDQSLQQSGFHPLVYLKGDAFVQINLFAKQITASAIYWNRRYEPWAMECDRRIKQSLKEDNIKVESFASFLMFEPWEIKNKSGDSYKVFTPFSKACLEKNNIREVLSYNVKSSSNAPEIKTGLSLLDLKLLPDINWYKEMESVWTPGEAGAQSRLQQFLYGRVFEYKKNRDYPAIEGISKLSPHLHFGEISPHQIWHSVQKKIAQEKNPALQTHATAFLRQLIWREFSYHLLYHAPDFPEKPWNKRFNNFTWQEDSETLKKWTQGKTGYPIIDAGMRELWKTGWMHNRVRMIVGSFLVKNMLQSWRKGEDWFWDTLVDADLGNNAAGWQWIAGCGADAAPYFRIFNPLLQSKKFDPDGEYIRKYLPELRKLPDSLIHTPWLASPLELKSAGIILGETYPYPIVDIKESRDRALKAYEQSKTN